MSDSDSGYDLIPVRGDADWAAYHDIRRSELFEARGVAIAYDPDHPDETALGHFPLLLKLNGRGIGTVRLDVEGDGTAIVRLVAIERALQRQGHGRILDKKAADFARSLGCGRLHVFAAAEAVGFYESVGWRRDLWAPGVQPNAIQMSKRIVA